jgi:hypothetical protein
MQSLRTASFADGAEIVRRNPDIIIGCGGAVRPEKVWRRVWMQKGRREAPQFCRTSADIP